MAPICLRGFCCASISLAALSIALPAVAQDADEETAANEQASGNTIFVTGLRRTDELQDTPAAITAFTADTIENARILRPVTTIVLPPACSLAATPSLVASWAAAGETVAKAASESEVHQKARRPVRAIVPPQIVFSCSG